MPAPPGSPCISNLDGAQIPATHGDVFVEVPSATSPHGNLLDLPLLHTRPATARTRPAIPRLSHSRTRRTANPTGRTQPACLPCPASRHVNAIHRHQCHLGSQGRSRLRPRLPRPRRDHFRHDPHPGSPRSPVHSSTPSFRATPPVWKSAASRSPYRPRTQLRLPPRRSPVLPSTHPVGRHPFRRLPRRPPGRHRPGPHPALARRKNHPSVAHNPSPPEPLPRVASGPMPGR